MAIVLYLISLVFPSSWLTHTIKMGTYFDFIVGGCYVDSSTGVECIIEVFIGGCSVDSSTDVERIKEVFIGGCSVDSSTDVERILTFS